MDTLSRRDACPRCTAASPPASAAGSDVRGDGGERPQRPCLELQITRIEAKAKLSQNRPADDVAGVVAGLTARGDDRSAAAVSHANHERIR